MSGASSAPSSTYGGLETIASSGPPTSASRSPRWSSTASPSRSAFARATSRASALESVATTSRSGRSDFNASAIAPEPVPTSHTRAPRGRLSSASTRCSVSGRGISTRGSTASSIERKPFEPRMYATGSRSRRRVAYSRKRRAASGSSARPGSATIAARSTPMAAASSSSASSRGVADPAAVSAITAESSASRTLVRPISRSGERGTSRKVPGARRRSGGGGVEPAALLLVLQRRGELVELALEQLVEVVRRELDPVVGHAPLGEVVRADLLGPLAGPDLGRARRRLLRLLLGQLGLVEPRAQHLHRALAVLQLRLLVLHRDDDARRLVRDPHRRVGRVDRLAAGPGRPVDVDLEVVRVDLHVDLLGLRQHRDGRRRGVDPALRLRLGHALDAVRAALELEHGVGAVAAHLERVRAVGSAQRLGLEAAPLGVAGEHPVEVARPQAGLLTARPGADLDDHVLVVGGIALDHRKPDLLLELGAALPRGLEHVAELGVLPVLGEQLLRARRVILRAAPLLRQLGGGGELVVQPPCVGIALPVPDHLGVGQLRLHVRVARLDLLDERLDHTIQSRRGRAARRPPARALRRRLAGAVDVLHLAAVDLYLRGRAVACQRPLLDAGRRHRRDRRTERDLAAEPVVG